jgi:hypothetical protein
MSTTSFRIRCIDVEKEARKDLIVAGSEINVYGRPYNIVNIDEIIVDVEHEDVTVVKGGDAWYYTKNDPDTYRLVRLCSRYLRHKYLV